MENSGSAIGGMVTLLIMLAVAVAVIAGMWKVFEKAGKPGWACLVPIYNLIVLLDIAGKPMWWFILFFVPLVNLIVAIMVSIEVAKAFDKGVGFGLGLAFLGVIFYPILGFDDSTYSRPS